MTTPATPTLATVRRLVQTAIHAGMRGHWAVAADALSSAREQLATLPRDAEAREMADMIAATSATTHAAERASEGLDPNEHADALLALHAEALEDGDLEIGALFAERLAPLADQVSPSMRVRIEAATTRDRGIGRA